MARPPARVVLSLVTLASAIAACGGLGKSSSPADPSGANSAAASCEAPSGGDAGLVPYETFASGTTTGASASASFCNAGVMLAASPIVTLTIDSSSLGASADVRVPTGGVSGSFSATLTLPSVAPGVYASSDADACGSLTFSYGTLLESEAACNAPGDADYTCPSGCTAASYCADASSYFCCVPLAETFLYQSREVSSCPTGYGQGQGTQTALGSWSLTLTRVTPFAGDAGYYADYETFYMAHGTLKATLAGTADTTDTATVSLTF